MRRVLLPSLLVWLGATAPSFASPDEAIEAIEVLGDLRASPIEALEEAFARWQDAARRGDSLALREAEDGVREALGELDLDESEPLAAAAIREMERRLEAKLPLAERVALFAVDLAPSFPAAHWGLARARFQGAPLSIGGWIRPLGDAFASILRTERHARPLLANIAFALVASLLAAGLVAMGAALVRHGRRLFHDLRHLLPGMPASIVAGPIALGALALLGAMVGGPLLWLGVGSVGLGLYLGRQERWILALFFLAAGQLAPALGWLEERTAWGGTTASLLDAVDARGDFSGVPRLRALAAEGRAEPEVLFALARFEKRDGRFEEAAALYDRALQLRPDWAPALVNRGNLFFVEGELDRAGETFRRATGLDEELAEAWFGLSRVHYRQVDIARGQEARARALALRPELAARYNAGDEEGARSHRQLADAKLSEAALETLEREEGESALAAFLWGPVSPSAAPIAGGLLGILLLVAPYFGPRTSRGCAQCGAPICRRCDRGLDESAACSACVQVMSRKPGLDPAIRNRKEVEIARYARRQRFVVRIASFAAIGPFLRGKAVWGFFLLPLLGIGVAGLLGGPHPPIFGGWPLGLRAAFLLPLLIAIGLSTWVSGREEG